MTQLGEAVARYHKLLESESFRDLSWVSELREAMQARGLVISGKPVSPFLRPNLIPKRQHEQLAKGSASLFSAINRMKQTALSNPQLMARMELLPAEKMLALTEPGYSELTAMSTLEASLNNGSLHFLNYGAMAPAGTVYSDILSELFYDCAPMKEFRKKHKLAKSLGLKPMLNAALKSWKEFGGKQKPQIAILETKSPFPTVESNEHLLLAEHMRKAGYLTEVMSPEQLEYKSGVLRRGEFQINLVLRRISAQDFVIQYDLTQPLVRAYRDKAVCVVNNFRAEIAQKRAIFDLITDETLTAKFPAAERKAIRDHVPWTRVVRQVETDWRGERVDLMDYIVENRESLVLRPNDENAELPNYDGATMDAAAWDRAIKTTVRTPYVVQEATPETTTLFPVQLYGGMEMKEMRVDVYQHAYLGKVHCATTYLSPAGSAGFSSVQGMVPTFLLESR